MKLSKSLFIYELRRAPDAPEVCYRDIEDAHCPVSGFRMLWEEDFYDDVIYVSPAEDLPALDRRPPHLIAAGLPEEAAAGVIYVDCPLPRLVNLLHGIMVFYSELEAALVNSITRNDPLRAVLSICARFFNNPITLSDERFRLIETSDNCEKERMPRHFKYVLETGYIDPEVLRYLKEKSIDERLYKEKAVAFVHLEQIPTHYFNKNIFNKRGVLVASFAVHDAYTPLDIAQTVVVDQIAQMIGNFVLNNFRNMPAVISNVERIIFDMLHGIRFDSDLHGHYFRQIHWGVHDGFILIRAEVNRRQISDGTMKYAFSAIHNLFPDSLLIEIDNVAVLVLCKTQIRYNLQEALDRLSDYLEKMESKAAVSMPFGEISQVREHFIAAAETTRLGRSVAPEAALYQSADYALQTLLAFCGPIIDLKTFCSPEALTLYRQDKSSGSEFFRTLYTYLYNNKSLQAAAEALHIHRNTLAYRLGRITEICGADLTLPERSFDFLLSYKILEFLENFSESAP